ncbi:hypothetical protein ES705_27158 [subsurface metagenome]
MNLIKWLKINSDIKLGKLKTEIKEDDVIIVKSISDIDDYVKKRFTDQLHKIFPDNIIIFLIKDINLDCLDEREMNKIGWYRK